MHFKRLEIQGYKSFAARTVFDIDPGITAVVGPNGSGKSNIMDALRWVMGETATRQMRARRLEDVIFAGSETRAPAGLAEVRLVLDNRDGWLSLDFSEVAVTRRVHRSGESEFRINDSRVRLRDLQELFRRGGLGAGSYGLMGQGLVEEVLRLKPEERRGLIEEAAGVAQHRRRMIEGRRRRQEAQENLARARLLIDEIAPRLRTLERQAKRALQHAELHAELGVALRRYYARERRRLHDETVARRAAARERAAERDRAEAAASQTEASMEAWRAELQAARDRLEQVSAERRRLAGAVRDLESREALTRERHDLLARRVAELQADLAALDAEAPPPGPAPAGQIESLESAAAAARAELAAAEEALRAVDAEQEELRRRRLELDDAATRLDREDAADAQRTADAGRELERLRREDPARAARLEAARERLAEAEYAAGEADTLAAAAEAAAAEAEARRGELARDHNLAAARLRDIEGSRGQRERRLTRARDRLQMLHELQAESEGMHQGLRALFGSRGVPREDEPTGIPGVVGVVRHLVRAPAGLEQAVEAALADYLDAVLFESTDEALDTMQILLHERAGRIIALPIDAWKERSPLALPSEPGVIGVASQLIRCNHRYRPLIDTLLGRTVIVEDVETGRDIIKRGLGDAVTREGYLLRASGALAGGRLAETGSFARESELAALPRQIEELERSLSESADIGQRRRDLESLALALREAESAAESAAAERARAKEAAAVLRAGLLTRRGELAAEQAEGERATTRLRSLEDIEGEVAAGRARRQEERGAAQAARPADDAFAAVAARHEQRLSALAAAQALLSAAEGERRTLVEAQRAAQAARERAAAARASREGQLTQAREALAALEAESAQLRTGLREARAQRDAVASSTAEESAEARAVAALAAQEPARREALQRTQRGHIEAEKALVAAQAALREEEAALEHLRQAMRADDLTLDGEGGVVPLDRAALPGLLSNGQAAPAGAAQAAGARSADAAGATTALAEAAPPAGDDAAPTRQPPPPPQPAQVEQPEEPIAELRDRVETLRGRLRWLGTVNPEAAAEFREIEARHDSLSEQVQDLEEAEGRLLEAEADLSALIQERFSETFARVDAEFQRYFRTMFRGGSARLVLTDQDNVEAAGVEIVAQPPGKRVENLGMLSGGERSLTAIALLFALLEVRPAPFCVLDEVDAALDEANVGRFVEALKQFAQRSQFVVITHNRRTIEQADSLYGITMGEDSVSRVLSVRLADLSLEEA